MPHVITHAMMSCVHHAACAHRQAGYPIIHGPPEITYWPAVYASQITFIKINHPHFNTINMQSAYQNVLERILIAM